jgi:hypothetical protein
MKALTILLTVVMICCTVHAWQQQEDAITREHAREERAFQTAANKWMKIPTDLDKQIDTVSAQDRQARDAYWDAIIGASAPLSDPTAKPKFQPIANPDPAAPELGDLGDGTMAIGKFEGYHTVLSASKRSIYTEIQLKIIRIFGQPSAPIQQGTIIDLDRPGGTVVAPWGATISYEVHPREVDLIPGHVYLIAFAYRPNGHFYVGGQKNGRSWDLTDGKVKPGNPLQKHRSEHRLSEIDGLSVSEVTDLLDKKFQEYYQRRR